MAITWALTIILANGISLLIPRAPGRPAGDGHPRAVGLQRGEGPRVADPQGAGGVHSALRAVEDPLRHGRLPRRNVLADLAVVLMLVNQPCRPQDQQAELLDLDP